MPALLAAAADDDDLALWFGDKSPVRLNSDCWLSYLFRKLQNQYFFCKQCFVKEIKNIECSNYGNTAILNTDKMLKHHRRNNVWWWYETSYGTPHVTMTMTMARLQMRNVNNDYSSSLSDVHGKRPGLIMPWNFLRAQVEHNNGVPSVKHACSAPASSAISGCRQAT